MRYAKIRKMDISNGPGMRVSVFFQGCPFHCKNCFNRETWDFEGGQEFTDSEIEKILDLSNSEFIDGLSILGGEPLHPKNILAATKLARMYKEKFKDKTIWLWTGYTFDDELSKKEIMNYVDVLVDGQYVDELHNPHLKWRGSSNQRVINIKNTIENDKIKLECE